LKEQRKSLPEDDSKYFSDNHSLLRAQKYINWVNNRRSYTDFLGIKEIRQNIASFIERRDSHPSDPDSIYLSNGASGGIKSLLSVLLEKKTDVAFVPIPQYPLYSATIDLIGCQLSGYYLNEEKEWSIDVMKTLN
jgi:aspartate/methionine/tyrosine aminotransferase